jgi:hypothetical protein
MSDETKKERGGYNFNKAPGIMLDPQYNPGLRSDNQSVVKTGSTVTKSSGQVVKNTATPDPTKLAKQANTSMSGSNVEFGQGVKNLASRIDRNQAGRRSMKQETTRRIQEGDFTHGYAKLPSDVKKDNGALLGKYDRKMLKASNKQKNRLNKAAAKLGLQVTNVGTVNGKTLETSADAKVTNSTKNNASSEKLNKTASSGTSMKDIVKNTKNTVGPGSGENLSGNNSKIDSNIKVKPGHAGYNPKSPAGPEDLQIAENKENIKFLKHEGKHLKVGEDYIPSNKNKTTSTKPFNAKGLKDEIGGKNLASAIVGNTSSTGNKTTSNQSNVDFFEIYKKEKLWNKDNLANYFKQNPIKK